MKKFGILGVLLILANLLLAQESPKIIQFTGIVFTPDSSSVIPGVHIYVPKGGRGTTSNPYGFFSMPVLEGDSVVFSAVGFKRSSYVVPKHDKESSLRVLLTMEEDIQFLQEVEVFPYPTEAMFKQAVLAMNPDSPEMEYMATWLASQYMTDGYRYIPAGANANYRYLLQQYQSANQDRMQVHSSNYLNPFAWAKFIREVKRKD